MASTPPPILAKQQEIIDMFSMIDDWQDRYRMIIDLGRDLPALADSLRTEIYRVKGCQSQVWLIPDTAADGSLTFLGDSDAAIVRGLVALVLQVYSGHPPADILQAPPSFVDAIGLNKHLSQNRANGLSAMLKRIQDCARDALGGAP
jgi:cysteine desulfuration protein SufE